MLAASDSAGQLVVSVAALTDALVDDARAVYAAHPSTPSIIGRVRYTPRANARTVHAALASGVADCVTLAAAECGRLRSMGVPASVVISLTANGAVHARVLVGSRVIYDPATVVL